MSERAKIHHQQRVKSVSLIAQARESGLYRILAVKLKAFIHAAWQTTTFILLLLLYVVAQWSIFFVKGFKKRTKNKGGKLLRYFRLERLSQFSLSFYQKAVQFLDPHREDTISRTDLIELAVKNMKAKKTRTVITVGGMMIGIGVIVFLVSIGYGLQRLVITRVARLEERKQASVSPQTGGQVKITDKILSNIKGIDGVEMALPLIAVVGRINYQNSVSDMVVYGVTSDYLKQSAIKPVRGKIFDSNELAVGFSSPQGQVAGVATTSQAETYGEKIRDVEFAFDPTSWIRVREKPSTASKIIGYTRRVEGISQGEEVWGASYISDDGVGEVGQTSDGKPLGRWIKAPLLLWEKKSCDPQEEPDCADGRFVVLRNRDNQQIQKNGYFAEISLSSIVDISTRESRVLGVTSDSQEASGSADVEWVEIASESATVKPPETKNISLSALAKRKAVVNRAVLKVLGLDEETAINKTFLVSFVVVGELLSGTEKRLESVPEEYSIVAVIPDEKTPVLYVPFIDLRSLGITNYSQIKVVAKDQDSLEGVRQHISSMGFVTQSVADTVIQITNLFSTVRTVLFLLGMVALAIASLGMLNTLTISLLERTREVGLMKAMGMKSHEVQELFLTESMVMGFFGGIGGIALGIILGKILSVIISTFSLVKGVGFINISSTPPVFVFVILTLSVIVGVFTGIYPARRATKISALNALRYE